MELKQALAAAIKFADPKQTGLGYHTVVIDDGEVIKATNGVVGCSIPFDEIEGLDVAVEGVLLNKVIQQVTEPSFAVKAVGRKKIRNLVVNGGSASFKIPEFPKASAPKHPDPPDWEDAITVDAEDVVLLAALSLLTAQDSASKMGGMCGVRLHPEWAGAVTHQSCAVLDVTGLVEEAATIPAFLFARVHEAVDLLILDNRVWLRGHETGQVRWALLIIPAWPDPAVAEQFPNITKRIEESGWRYQLDPDEFVATLKRAEVVRADETVYQIQPDDSGLMLSTARGKNEFSDRIDLELIEGPTGETEPVPFGLIPKRVADVVSIISGASTGPMTFMCGDAITPMVLEYGKLRVMMMPIRI